MDDTPADLGDFALPVRMGCVPGWDEVQFEVVVALCLSSVPRNETKTVRLTDEEKSEKALSHPTKPMMPCY